MRNIDIIKRLYNNYTKQFLPKILLSVFFSVLVAGSTASIAWLLDPAIKKIFIDKDQTLTLVIPLIIILAFSTISCNVFSIASSLNGNTDGLSTLSFGTLLEI